MPHRSHRRAALAALSALVLLAGACSRSDDEGGVDAGGETTDTTAASSDTTGGAEEEEEEANRLDSGGFGDLEAVCQDGEPAGASDTGVTDDAIQVGLVTDKGFSFRPGLNEEMFQAANAFAAWCNEHGGIGGRELIIADRDAAYSEYNTVITAACTEDFALVGGGAVQDETDNGAREACGLPNLPGFVVSAAARDAGLQVQALPNPLRTLMAGHYQALAEQFPDLIDSYGLMGSPVQSVALVADTSRQAALESGFTMVYESEYSPIGIDAPTARTFVDQMQSAGVEILEFVGEPVNLTVLQEAMATAGYRPQIFIQPPNFYDQLYVETAGANAVGTYVRTQFTPFELADTNPATADYLELMERYQPDGKVALLGSQAVSALLLFAQSANACGAQLTRNCLLEEAGSVTDWTGGGLHSPQDPSTGTPSSCFAVLEITDEGFVVNEELTAANEGIFNCDPENIIDVDVPG